MHNEFRTEAQAALELAKENDTRFENQEIVIQNYSDCIHKFLNLEHKIDDDFRALETAYGRLAVYYFNKDNQENFQYARDSYIYAIKVLLQIKNITDDDYRKFAQHYADLADVFRILCDEVQWNQSFDSAIQAFECIQDKNEGEKFIGNPRENVSAFRLYFARKTASSLHINSPTFQNHTKLLIEYQEDKNLLQAFDNIHIDEEKMVQKSIEDMLQAMTLHHNKTHKFFTNFSYGNPCDSQYRTLATQFLHNVNIALNHYKLGEAIQFLLDALGPLQNIQEKSDQDILCIQNIKNHIEHLLGIQKRANMAVESENCMQNNNNFGVNGNVFIPTPIRPDANYEYDWSEYSDADMNVETKHHF